MGWEGVVGGHERDNNSNNEMTREGASKNMEGEKKWHFFFSHMLFATVGLKSHWAYAWGPTSAENCTRDTGAPAAMRVLPHCTYEVNSCDG